MTEPIDPIEARAAVMAWRREQRAALLGARQALAAGTYRAASRAIAARLETLLETLGPAVLGGYWPIRREFNPLALLRSRRSAGLPIALPRVAARDAPLEFRLWPSGARMARGVYDIPYPADTAVVLPDTLLVPMLGFDAAGYRLGYGGGYYDRTAALQPRPHLIGIAFEHALLPTIQPLGHDIPMDWIVTEEALRAGPAARGV